MCIQYRIIFYPNNSYFSLNFMVVLFNRKNTINYNRNFSTCFVFVYVYIFYESSIIWGYPGNIFYWIIPINVFFRNTSIYNVYIHLQYYGGIEEAKSVPLKLLFNFLQWNYHCQPSLVKKFYIIKKGNRVTTMAFYFCLGKIHFTRVLLCGKNWTYFAQL